MWLWETKLGSSKKVVCALTAEPSLRSPHSILHSTLKCMGWSTNVNVANVYKRIDKSGLEK